jgi:hypothetical protein
MHRSLILTVENRVYSTVCLLSLVRSAGSTGLGSPVKLEVARFPFIRDC